MRVGGLCRTDRGISRDQRAIGWRLKPYVVVEADRTASRGKVVRLTSLGNEALLTYRRIG